MKFAAISITLTFIIMLIVAIGLLDEAHPTPVVIVTDSLRLTPSPEQPLYFPASNPLLDPRAVVQISTMTATVTKTASLQPAVPTPLPHGGDRTSENETITQPEPEPNQEPTPQPVIQNPTPEPIITPPVQDSTPASKPADTKWGVFSGDPNGIAEFEAKVPYNPDFLAYFVHWGNDGGRLPEFLKADARDKGRELVLFWEASDWKIGGTNQPEYAYRRILDGDWDEYFDDFYTQLEAYQGDIILIPFSELNGNWTPWSGTLNGNTPAEAIAAFRYVYRKFSPLENVKIGLAYNAASVPNTPENQIENYYPGSDFVDIIGVDGFNGLNEEWLSFDEIFGRPLERLARYNKPVMIFSFASGEGPNKDEWLRDMFYTQLPKHPYVTGWVYFNQNKEKNWLIWSDEPALEIFNETVKQLNEY